MIQGSRQSLIHSLLKNEQNPIAFNGLQRGYSSVCGCLQLQHLKCPLVSSATLRNHIVRLMPGSCLDSSAENQQKKHSQCGCQKQPLKDKLNRELFSKGRICSLLTQYHGLAGHGDSSYASLHYALVKDGTVLRWIQFDRFFSLGRKINRFRNFWLCFFRDGFSLSLFNYMSKSSGSHDSI